MAWSATANWFAYSAILAWPVVALVLYRGRPFLEATIWTVLGALLLLPSQASIKVPMIPAIDKDSVAGIAAMVAGIALTARRSRALRGFGFAEALCAIYLLSPVITSVLNNDTIVVGERILPGVGLYDGVSALLSQTIAFFPLFIGRRLVRSVEDNEIILRALAVAGLFFSLPMLLEVRISPQLSNLIYGYFVPFNNELRYGGYRPVVFMSNGLTATFFLATSFLAMAALFQVKRSISRVPTGLLMAYLSAVVVVSKSAGALVYAVVGGVLLRWTKPTAQVRVAVLLVSIAILYPVLRMTNYFPTSQMVELAAEFNRDRADSLKYRFDQEQELLAHASERLLFGWGRYGRNRVYEETGKDSSVTDGLWILTLGQFGLIGFLSQFGLLAYPVFYAATALRQTGSLRERIFLSALALIVAITLVEQLPNASLTTWSWLLVGALLGRAENITAKYRINGLQIRRPAAPREMSVLDQWVG
jgi:hypothetical protein